MMRRNLGWRGESYRHYLAAKGVRTGYLARGDKLREALKRGEGKISLYHGTIRRNVPSVMESGLIPGDKLGVEGKYGAHGSEHVYVSPSVRGAAKYAEYEGGVVPTAKGEVLLVRVDANDLEKTGELKYFRDNLDATPGEIRGFRLYEGEGVHPKNITVMPESEVRRKVFKEIVGGRRSLLPMEREAIEAALKEFNIRRVKGDDEFYAVKAWPLGPGQQRFVIRRGAVTGLEPVSVNVEEVGWLPKNWRNPVTEEEVAKELETYTPEEYGTGPTEVLISASAPIGGIFRLQSPGTYGEAQVNRKIRLYGKPVREGKYPNVARSSLRPLKYPTEEEMKEFYLHDVLPHEVGHIRLGHTRPRRVGVTRRSEWEAEEFARKWRERRGIREPEVTAHLLRQDVILPEKADEQQIRLSPKFIPYPYVDKQGFDVKAHERRIGLR